MSKRSDDNKHQSLEEAILGELRGLGAAGVRYETLRADVARRASSVDDTEFDVTMDELRDRRLISDGLSGAGFVALTELVRAAADECGDGAEAVGKTSGEPKPLDTLPVLAALQLLGEAGGGVEDLQREIEASGSGRHPLGAIVTVAQKLVDAGKARREGADEAEVRFWLVVDAPALVLERRAKLVHQLAQAVVDLEQADDKHCGCVLLSEAVAAGAVRDDIDVLVAAGVVVERESHDEDDEKGKADPAYELKADAFEQVLRVGATAIASRTVDALSAAPEGPALRLAPDAPPNAAPADASTFERAAAEKAELERKRADALQVQLNTMKDNLRRYDLNPEWFAAPPPPAKLPEEEVEFKERRIVDLAEQGAILKEILVLERKVASKEAEFGILKGEHKSGMEELAQEIKELKEASESNARTVIVRARKERDWTNGVLRIVAIEDGRVLEEKPLPKGEQRTIPGTEAAPAPAPPPPEAGATPASAEAIEAFKQNFSEKNGQTAPVAPAADGAPTSATAAPSVIVDLEKLSKAQRLVYEALNHMGCAVPREALAAAAQSFNGKPVGGTMAAKLEEALEQLVGMCVVVKDGDNYRVLGAPSTKPTPAKSPKDRIWDALGGEPKLKSELRMKANVTEDELDKALDAFKKAGKLATTGRAKGTRYSRARAPGPEARA